MEAKDRVTWRRLINSPILREERRKDDQYARGRWNSTYMDNKITFNCLQTKTTSFTRGGTRYIKSLGVLFVTHRKGLWSQIKARATPKLVSFRGLGDQFITTFWFGCSPPQGPLTQGSNEDLNKTKFKISLVLFLRLILQLSNCNVFMKWFSSSRLQTTCLPSSTKHLSYHLNLRRLPGFHQCLYKGLPVKKKKNSYSYDPLPS